MTSSAPGIYLDNNSTTRPADEVVEAVSLALTDTYANPSNNLHEGGRLAAEAVERGRIRTADLIGAQPKEIVFTSGATESCNLAIKGVAAMYRESGKHVITSLAEHKAVLGSCDRLESQGFEITRLQPDAVGRISAEQVEDAIRPNTVLISIMAANNVVGTLNPMSEIGEVAKRRSVLFHSDATQAVGRIPVDVQAWGVDLLSLSGHKLHGPKGIGALYLRGLAPKVRLQRQSDGGGQENKLRAGTVNTPGVVGLGVACELAKRAMELDLQKKTASLRDRLLDGIRQRTPNVILNGCTKARLPNTLNISFPGVDAIVLMRKLSRIMFSVGSACAGGADDPHYVLRAMGSPDEVAVSSCRFSLSRFTTEEEIDLAAAKISEAVKSIRLSGAAPACSCEDGCCK
jgi:cysteine desulfurase